MRSMARPVLCAASIWLATALANWQFRSRPDLAPPRLDITISAFSEAETGFFLVAPFAGLQGTATEEHSARQAGPYIFRDDGELVRFGYGYYSIWATDFQVVKWRGQDDLVCFDGDHNPFCDHWPRTRHFLRSTSSDRT